MKKILVVLLVLLPFLGFTQVKLFTTDASKEYPDGTRITYFTVSDCPDDSEFLAYAKDYVLKDDRMIRFLISDDGKSCFYEARKEVTEDMLVDLLNEAYFDFYNNAQNSLNDNDSNPIKSFKKSNYDGKSYRVGFKLEDTPNIENVKNASIVLKEKGNFDKVIIMEDILFEIHSLEPISADFVIQVFEEFGLKIEEEFIK